MNVAEIEKVHVTQDRLGFELKDGRLISVPLAFYPTLQHASEAERLNYEISPVLCIGQIWIVTLESRACCAARGNCRCMPNDPPSCANGGIRGARTRVLRK